MKEPTICFKCENYNKAITQAAFREDPENNNPYKYGCRVKRVDYVTGQKYMSHFIECCTKNNGTCDDFIKKTKNES